MEIERQQCRMSPALATEAVSYQSKLISDKVTDPLTEMRGLMQWAPGDCDWYQTRKSSGGERKKLQNASGQRYRFPMTGRSREFVRVDFKLADTEFQRSFDPGDWGHSTAGLPLARVPKAESHLWKVQTDNFHTDR